MTRFRIAMIDPAQAPLRAHWAKALGDLDLSQATVLKHEGPSAVLRARVLDRDVVIKTRSLRGQRLKWLTKAARGFRHWRGARILTDLGLSTARPLVLGSRRGSEWLVLEAIDGRTVLEHIARADLDVRRQHALARALGRHISAMRRAGLFNRDFKPSNIMVRWSGLEPEITVIDCVAIRRGRQPERMLHALAIEPLGLRILPRRTLQARVLSAMVDADFEDADADGQALRMAKWATRRGFRDLVRDSIARHGDPTPRTNPLART